MTDEGYAAAVLDWCHVQQLWVGTREAAVTKAAHASLDEFFQQVQNPAPPTEETK
jgi:hypothetical protein